MAKKTWQKCVKFNNIKIIFYSFLRKLHFVKFISANFSPNVNNWIRMKMLNWRDDGCPWTSRKIGMIINHSVEFRTEKNRAFNGFEVWRK